MKQFAIAAVLLGGGIIGGTFLGSGTVEVTKPEVIKETEIVNDFDYRVEALMASTSDQWARDHREWAEAQIHLEDIERAENALEELPYDEPAY